MRDGAFGWYLIGVVGWFAHQGAQMVLYPWLVAIVLHEPAGRVGLAQAALLGPGALLILVGGAVADHVDGRRLLRWVHALAALPPLVLAGAVAGGKLGYPLLIGYGLVMGAIAAFAVPARDAMLTRVAPAGLERAIAATTMLQALAQLAGILVAGAAKVRGVAVVLIAQSLLLAVGGVATAWLVPAPPLSSPGGARRLEALGAGLREIYGSRRVLPVMLATLAAGVFYGGAYTVAFPLIVRDGYGGGLGELALLNGGFWSGTIVAVAIQLRLGALRRPGRAIVLALGFGAVVLAGMSMRGPFAVLVALAAGWGFEAGIVLTQGRTIVQVHAPAPYRARMLAAFQLAFGGAAPVGAVVLGALAGVTGVRGLVWLPAAAMLVVLLWLVLETELWETRATRAQSYTP